MERQFVVFSRVVDGMPHTIQSGVIQPDERSRFTWVGTASLAYEPQDFGLPKDGELTRIGKIEDQLIEALERSGSIFVGHVTGSNHMRVMFYAAVRGPQSLQVKTGLLKKEEVALEWRHDPDWTLYEFELKPTAEEAMMDRFRNLWYRLYELGDNPDLPRQVDFAFIFSTEEARSAFLAEAHEAGYTSEDESSPGKDGQFWCELNKTTPIAPEVLVHDCVRLDDLAVKHGGEFDGWACHVTK
jgi:hypothetical protein